MEFLGSEVCSVGSSLFVLVLSAQRGASCCFPAEAFGSSLPGTPREYEMFVITNRGAEGATCLDSDRLCSLQGCWEVLFVIFLFKLFKKP